MSIPFDRLGLLFKLFSPSFYPRGAKQHAADLIRTIGPGGLVVDVGGGTGVLLNLAHAIRSDITCLCIDPALGMLRYVPAFAYRVAARSEELPLVNGMIDAVMIGDAFHHFTDPDGAIEEVHRILKPGGRLFIFDIDPKTPMGRMAVRLEMLLGEPANFRSPEQLQELLAWKDFSVLTKTGGWRYTVEARKAPLSGPV